MPRISIQIINGNVSSADPEILTLDFPFDFTVHDLKNTIHNETQSPVELQHLYLDSIELDDPSKSLDSIGVKDGDMLVMILLARNLPHMQQRQRQLGQQGTSQPSHNPDPESYRLRLIENPRFLAQIREQRPALAATLNDPVRFREAMSQMFTEGEERWREKRRKNALLNNDPLNVEAQREIEEQIRFEQVLANAEEAVRNNPEVYGRVTMLYIDTVVNGHPIKALVDSGAQATIMSVQCAEACGIMRLLDKRYSGVAKGVGTARILGHVHSAEITIGDAILRCSFTVMEGKDIDLLFGLDMLKRYQACIDLFKNKLVFQGHEVPFLPESEIPKHLEEAALNEPIVPGPDGTEIGAKSGAIRPAGTTSSHTASAAAGRSAASGAGGQHSGANATGSSSGGDMAAKTAASAAAPMYPQSAIDQLVSLGFSKDEAVSALNATGGNVDYAAGLLFQN